MGMIRLSDIKLNPTNPRSIKEDKFKKLVKSIKESTKFLEARPIVVKDGVVFGGNMRLRALQELGYTEVPDEWIKDVSGWTDEDIRKFIVVDNIAYGDNDWDLLSEQYEKEELEEWGMDVDKWGEDDVVEDEVPEVTDNPVSKLGEVYQLGRHRIMCGDSTKIEDVEKLMDGKKADMVFTDPPYGVDYTGGIQFTKEGVKTNQRERLVADDKETDIYSKVVPILASICNGPIYTWFSDTQVVPVYQSVKRVGDIHALIICVKNGGYSSMNANYKQKHEPCLYWKAKGKKLNFVGPTTETTIWEINKDGINKLHPTQKPVSLASRAIMNHSAGLVLDLFLGSGSTLIACEQTNRINFGCEIDPKYIDVIIKRWMKFTGQRAYKIIDAEGKQCNEPVQFADESFMQLKK